MPRHSSSIPGARAGAPRAPRRRSLWGGGLALLGSAFLMACASTPRGPTVFGDPERLAELQPGDIAVAPIRNEAGHGKLPWEELRGAFEVALLERLYSPLSSEYVDGNWVESAFRGTPAPDALLVVAMERWDTDRLYQDGIIEAGAQVLLFEGGDATGPLLWGMKVREDLDMRQGRSTPPGPSPRLIPEAAKAFARRALAGLPNRDPQAAHP